MMRPLIRSAEVTDLPAITAIYAQAVMESTATFEYDPPGLGEMVGRFSEIQVKGYPYLVAVVEERVVGYCYASAYRPRVGYRYTVENSVYVDPAYQGQGIAKTLLMTLIGICTEQGYRQMVAVIGDGTNQASVRLHESCGFTVAGTFKAMGYKFGRWLDSVHMMRALGEGGVTPPGG